MDLLQRVRWANVARLLLAVGAGLLIAIGPHGCKRAEPQVAPLPRAVPPTSTAAPRAREPELRRPRLRHRRPRRQLRHRARPRLAAPAITPSLPAPVPAPRPVAPPRPGPPRSASGEFF